MKNAVINGNAKDQPPYRMIQSVDAEALKVRKWFQDLMKLST